MNELLKALEMLISKGLLKEPAEAYLNKFQNYMNGILSWNEKVNLTSITEPEEFYVKHFLDSILTFEYDEFQKSQTVIDIGTGGGFPGVPLAILAADKNFVLVDSLNKRLKIVELLCREAEIENVTIMHGRAEELGHRAEFRQKFDLCVSRAVSNLSSLCEYCLPFIKSGGYLFAYKGPDGSREVSEAENSIKLLGGKLVDCREVDLTDLNINHMIVVIKKVKDTPSKYPRKAGTPTKEPL